MIKSPKQKKCKCGCGDSFVPRRSTDKWVNSDHYRTWLLSTPEGQKEIEKKALKAKKQVAQDEKKEWSEKVNKWRPVTHEKEYKRQLQIEINKLSRMIDAKFGYNTCIDCGKPFGNQVDAAHFNGIGSNHSIRYNLHNLHSAKSDCNQYSDKHKQGYEEGLKKRYGLEYYERVCNLPSVYTYVKVSAVEVYEKLKIVRGINRHFATYDAPSSVSMREMFNKIIGIYDL